MRTFTMRARLLLTSVATMLVLSVTLVGATVVLAAKPVNTVAVDLDQCRNGGLADPQDTWQQCVTTGSGQAGWVNGNAGASNAHFAEGESISYRARLTGLPANAQVTLILGYDVIHNGHDAIDFLTDKNRWQTPETSAGATPDDPCSSVPNCPDGESPDSLIAIDPPETNVQVDTTETFASGDCQQDGSGAVQQPLASFTAIDNAGHADMELFGGINGDFAYVGPDPDLLEKNGDQEQQVQITFTATRSNPVLAWGGHIASRLDWGCADGERSASAISGSPYHMRIKSAVVNNNPVSLGNQDRSLSASAVIFIEPSLSTTPNGSANYDATVTDSLNVGVTGAGGSADFFLYDGLTNCQNRTNAVFTSLDVAVSNGVTGTVTATNVAGLNDLTGNHTFYWFVHYDGSSDPNVLPADSNCTESVAFTAPGVTPAGS